MTNCCSSLYFKVDKYNATLLKNVLCSDILTMKRNYILLIQTKNSHAGIGPGQLEIFLLTRRSCIPILTTEMPSTGQCRLRQKQTRWNRKLAFVSRAQWRILIRRRPLHTASSANHCPPLHVPSKETYYIWANSAENARQSSDWVQSKPYSFRCAEVHADYATPIGD